MDTKHFDELLNPTGPQTIVVTEALIPAAGGGPISPPTYMGRDGTTTYNLWPAGDGRQDCRIDNIAAESNYIEPTFKGSGLVPTVTVKIEGKSYDLLDAGHRAADGLIRGSTLKGDVLAAFAATLPGPTVDHGPICKIAPTSVLFGAFESRNTRAKLTRIFAAWIDATDVYVRPQRVQYNPATLYREFGAFQDWAKKEKIDDKALGVAGYAHQPVDTDFGGVFVRGSITRYRTVSLILVRRLRGATPEDTRTIQRYILGLALVALTTTPEGYLRSGCDLCPDPSKPPKWFLRRMDGTATDFIVTAADARTYAEVVAKDFGVGPDREGNFEISKMTEEFKKTNGKNKTPSAEG